MPLLRSVYYRCPFDPARPSYHRVPLEAAQALVNEPNALPSCLSDHTVLAQVTLVAGDQVLHTTPEMVLRPRGENEVHLPAESLRGVPARVPAEAQLVVKMVLLTGPFGQEDRPPI